MQNKPWELKLDLQLFAQEKTEKATPEKRKESRKKGQVAKSTELPGAFILFFTFLFMLMFIDFFKGRILQLFSTSFHDYLLMELSSQNAVMMFQGLLMQGFILLSPILATTVIIAFVGNYVQIGFLLTGDPLLMKLEKINPLKGAKRIFSARALVEFLKSILKVTIIGFVVYFTLWGEKDQIVALSRLSIEDIMAFTAHITIMLGIKIGAIMVILAVFDYIYQRYEFEKGIRMSKQDIKAEYKKSEGDPLIKGKIREKQRAMAMQRMMQEVPKADVIITNPTHYAIALKYNTAEMEAPLVLAKGRDFVALKIKKIAEDNEIITMENKPLARALYEQVEIGEAIPAELFQAVAEVLAYVYKVKGNVQ